MAWYDFITKPITTRLGKIIGKQYNLSQEDTKKYTEQAYDQTVDFFNNPENIGKQLKDSLTNAFDDIKQGMQDLVQGATETFVDPLTGQTAENQRTHETNEYNLKQVQETNKANRDIAAQTNQTNKDIATENIAYQRELQEYQKALQEKIFEREDTAYQRTKADMLAAGLNPLTMQGTNGSGEAIAMSPLNNSFQSQIGTPMQAHQAIKANQMGSIASIAPTILSGLQAVNSLKTGKLQRDSLQLQNERQQIDNFIRGKESGLYTDDYIKDIRNKIKYETNQAKLNYDSQNREYQHNVTIGRYAGDSDFEKIITALDDWIISGRGKDTWNKIKEQFPLLNLFDMYLNPNTETKIEVSNPFSQKLPEGVARREKDKVTKKWKYYNEKGELVDENGKPLWRK